MKARNMGSVLLVLLLAGSGSVLAGAMNITGQGNPFMTNSASPEDTGFFSRWLNENVYPHLVDGNNETSADTWGKPGSYDSVGFQFPSGISGIQRFEWDLQIFPDGGWFDSADAPVVIQVAVDSAFGAVPLTPGTSAGDDGIWRTVAQLHDYPDGIKGSQQSDPNVPADSTTYTFEMDYPGTIYGVRIVGNGGGSIGVDASGFLAAEEIRVFTNDSTIRATAISPAQDQMGVKVATAVLQWMPAQKNGAIDPNVVGHYVYLGTDPNGLRVSGETALPVETTSFSPALEKDADYYWHVDTLLDDGSILKGYVYSFQTELTIPILDIDMPADQKVDPDLSPSVTFEVEAGNPFYPGGTLTDPTDGLSYQWQSDNGGGFVDITGETSDSLALSIAWDDGQDIAYRCVVSIVDDGIGNSGGSIYSRTASLTYIDLELMAHWKMDNDFVDSSNSSINYNGSPTGAPVFEAGKINNAMKFDGIDDSVQIPSGFDDFTLGMTLSAWVKPKTKSAWGRILDLANGPANDNILFCRENTSDNLVLEIYQGPLVAGRLVAFGAFELNSWQMLTVTVDASGNAKLYKNGLEIAAGTVPLPPVVMRASNFIGKSNWPDPLYAGSMDDVRVYNYALSATDVAELYLLAPDIDHICIDRPAYDLDGDCVVDINDFSTIASAWMECNIIPVSACDE